MRGRFFRRFGCGLVIFIFFGSTAIITAPLLLAWVFQQFPFSRSAAVPINVGIFFIGVLALLMFVGASSAGRLFLLGICWR